MIAQNIERKYPWFTCLVLLLSLGSIITFVSCSRGDLGEDKTLLVFSAASLVDVLNETRDEFQRETGIELFFNFGGSQKLAIDIISGAPADMFISAGYEPIRTVSNLPEIDPNEIVNIASNRLVVASKDKMAGLMSVDDLLSMSRVSLADPELAPAGYYAKKSLIKLGLWDDIFPLIIYGGDVRMAMAYVEVGNADAAIVYETDIAASSDLIGYDLIPYESYPQIVYPAVPLDRNMKHQYAIKYLEFLKSEYVVDAFSRHGFNTVND